MTGHVFITATKAHPGLVRIDETRQDPETFVTALSDGSDHPLQLIGSFVAITPDLALEEVRLELAEYRLREGSLWFRIDALEAVQRVGVCVVWHNEQQLIASRAMTLSQSAAERRGWSGWRAVFR